MRLLPIQRYHGGVPVVNEDVGAALDGSNRGARYHLHSHTVVTVHHVANDLNLQSDDRYSGLILCFYHNTLQLVGN